MKKKYFFCIFLFFIICSFNLLAENFPQKASKVEDFIPNGWKSVVIKKGDLNKDKIDDVVLIIEKNDPKNLKKNEESYQTSPENYNPRIILVLFKDKNSKYVLVTKNDKGFIISPGEAYESGLQNLESPDFDNDLSKSVTIKNNTLRIFTFAELTRSSGSSIYIFRYQNNRFELIGLENQNIFANAEYIDTYNYSFNFSTKKLKIHNLREKLESNMRKEEKIEKKLNIKESYVLDTMLETTGVDILDTYAHEIKK